MRISNHAAIDELLQFALATKSDLARIADEIIERELQDGLAQWLEEPLRAADLSPVPFAIAKVIVDTLKNVCDDELLRASTDNPQAFLQIRRPPQNGDVPRSARVWVAARLTWFTDVTQEDIAEHLGVSSDRVVRRLLTRPAKIIRGIWIARYVPPPECVRRESPQNPGSYRALLVTWFRRTFGVAR
ncbi:hypothetical protein BH23CHL2_BH23CHL2_19760 [soil metagenome]